MGMRGSVKGIRLRRRLRRRCAEMGKGREREDYLRRF
jgi:hypothetical protein